MKKILRELINKFGEEAICHVGYIQECNTYGVVRESDGLILAFGKGLKGYIGDIIRVMYDGYNPKNCDYILESDRHGTICKWKA